MERIRKVDVNSLKSEDIDNLSNQISEKVNEIMATVNKATKEANKLLNIYGMHINIEATVGQIDDVNLDQSDS
jgi:hypothetical protein